LEKRKNGKILKNFGTKLSLVYEKSSQPCQNKAFFKLMRNNEEMMIDDVILKIDIPKEKYRKYVLKKNLKETKY